MLINITGWTGAVILLIAYALLSGHKLTVKSYKYKWMNIIGSLMLGMNALYYRALPSVAIEVAWIAIALVLWVKVMMQSKKHKQK